jgi:hypothetical protein
MPMASQDPLPQAIDFLSQCEGCHKMVGTDLWFVNGEYLCDECYGSKRKIHQCRNYRKIEIKYDVSVIQKNIYGWTKWYGANNNLFVITPEWYCQSCGQQQTKELPSYLIRIQDQEYARICSVCLHVALERKINNLFSLMEIQHPLPCDF